MSLTTRCKHCQTVFRITLEQLQAHGGQVRCGRCMQVFNGLDVLAPDAAMSAGDTSARSPQTPASAVTGVTPPPEVPPTVQPDAADPVPVRPVTSWSLFQALATNAPKSNAMKLLYLQLQVDGLLK